MTVPPATTVRRVTHVERQKAALAALVRVAGEERAAGAAVEDARYRLGEAAADLEMGVVGEEAVVAAEAALDEAERLHRRKAAAVGTLHTRAPAH